MKVKISKPFEIKTGKRQGDGLFPFKYVLKKVVNEWHNEKLVEKLDQTVELGRTNIDLACLAFANTLAILTHDIQMVKNKSKYLKKQQTK